MAKKAKIYAVPADSMEEPLSLFMQMQGRPRKADVPPNTIEDPITATIIVDWETTTWWMSTEPFTKEDVAEIKKWAKAACEDEQFMYTEGEYIDGDQALAEAYKHWKEGPKK